MIRIEESDMIFEFPEEQVFEMEKTELNKTAGDEVKSVEFIVHRRQDTLSFIEAKSSSPQPVKDNNEDFEKFINEISSKFIHSFNLYYATIFNRYSVPELSDKFRNIDNQKIEYKFLLIINGHEYIEGLAFIKEALIKKLNYHLKIWKSEIIVLNDKTALKKRLIIEKCK